MDEIVRRRRLGVPVSRIARDLGLIICRPSLANLIKMYEAANEENNFEASLFPVWLNEEDPIQCQPDNWYYEGFFPFGTWKHD